MPTTAEAPSRGFSLSNLDMPPDLPDNLPVTGTPGEATPAVAPKQEAAPAPEKPEPEAKVQPEPERKPEPEDDIDPEAPKSLTEALEIEKQATEEEEKAKAEEAKAKVEEPKKEEKPEDAEKKPEAKDRDADLKYEASPHTQPKTRKLISNFQTAAKNARDERDAAIKRAEAAELKAKEVESKVTTVDPNKELAEKLKVYEERIRELDITRDPAIEAKYDAKMRKNETTIVDVLKKNGYGMKQLENGKTEENPKAIAALVKSGLNSTNLQPLIKKLEEAGEFEAAEEIADALRENRRLGKEKEAEIQNWKGDYEGRVKQREEEAKKAQTERQNDFQRHTQTAIKTDVDALQKEFTSLNAPPAPQPNDPPAVARAKQVALDEYTAAAGKVQEIVKGFDIANIPPAKQAEAVGKLNSYAVQGVLIRQQLLPSLMKQIATQAARIKELEASDKARRDAGAISRAQSGVFSNEPSRGGGGKGEPQTLEEAFGSGPT